jgi:phospholipid/cholesterol/gamma-HCH transport system permease protein
MADGANIGLTVRTEDGRTHLSPTGDWTARTVGAVDARLRELEDSVDAEGVVVDLGELGRIDTAGAFVLGRILSLCAAPNGDLHFTGSHPSARQLMVMARELAVPCPPPPPAGPGIIEMLDRAGRGLMSAAEEVVSSFAFFGEALAAAGRGIKRPDKIRWAPAFHVMEAAGLNALPIVATLSFFIGATVAYLGAQLLQQFGASVFAVELVAIAVLREFAVVITAVLLAGRSDSAFTAQIGAMRMQQEIDAMKVLGLDPFDALVLPRIIAMILMTPLLTFGAMMMGMFGGMMVLWATLDITPGFFIARMYDTIPIQHFWVGMSKSPVFALVIAIVGCRHGLEVGHDVESLGARVTASVVQSIFAVIVLDAVFAMIYLELDI